MPRRALAAALTAALVGSAVFYGAPRLAQTLRLAKQLAPLNMEARKATLFGQWYTQFRELRRQIPANAAVDIVMLTPASRDIAVLGGPLLQPRDVRYFEGWEAWRRRERARFFHDARAANAPPAPPSARAPFTVAIDASAADPVRLVR